ncbi:unnamed protein product [Bursaphelenchus xylophilus]|uniref:(pine wood nematode) hypothetical protein n=1 Tax=Bursaphelenchus xylophilus TaxID=6326 RepID=A0A1I7RNE9_BURXY|nr:unnamed protein product [Bursaphelenchus xylophilus]CAG9123945.1 unnamed protein product [Bursaphelenchus xylophilus]
MFGNLFRRKKQPTETVKEHTPNCLYSQTSRSPKISFCSVSSVQSFSSTTTLYSRQCPSSSQPSDSYQSQLRFCCRRSESALLAEKHPNKVLLIIERFKTEKQLRKMDKKHFLLPPEATVAQLKHVISSRVSARNESLFLLIDDEIPDSTTSIRELARRHRDPDGFLYVKYSSEDTMG